MTMQVKSYTYQGVEGTLHCKSHWYLQFYNHVRYFYFIKPLEFSSTIFNLYEWVVLFFNILAWIYINWSSIVLSFLIPGIYPFIPNIKVGSINFPLTLEMIQMIAPRASKPHISLVEFFKSEAFL